MNYLLVFVLLIATVFSAVISSSQGPTTAAGCGKLGIMPVPKGTNPSKYRKCLGHPLGDHFQRNSSNTDYAPMSERSQVDTLRARNEAKNSGGADADIGFDGSNNSTNLEGREVSACYFAAPYGCSRGWCWMSCGEQGQWCWTARSLGIGPWQRCSVFQHCEPSNNVLGCGGACSC